eukprot:TRINITY_DN41141_c0_g1_i1.p1 TRINITY_DN41141_c0_g1~~TRINITY_DN41141_c0_g1_i1.p1  ORF type:complete len:176 (-),score=38.93 TRINITY_DN41141_c0_g1_i1:62-589(-)
MPDGTIFVTVGTTSFEDLVKEVDSEQFHSRAKALGYRRLVVQRGRGSYIPCRGVDPAASGVALETESFDFKPSLDDAMDAASLVISHAGAGSVIGALRAGRRLLVVVNPSLMDNHQLELAEAMHRRGFCAIARKPSDLMSVLEQAATMEPQPYPAADLRLWHGAVEEACGVNPAG